MPEGVYWDTSALLKLYVAEPDSPYFLELLAGSYDPVLSSSIATTEVLCALYCKEHAGDLEPGAAGTVFRRLMSDVDAGRIPYPTAGMSSARQALWFGLPSAGRDRCLSAAWTRFTSVRLWLPRPQP